MLYENQALHQKTYEIPPRTEHPESGRVIGLSESQTRNPPSLEGWKDVKSLLKKVVCMCSILLLFGCELKVEEATLEEEPEPGISGGQGLFHFNRERETETTTRSPIGLGVNGYLWRATLETLSFLPIASADPFGGLIITEWYSPPETPNERFKLNIHILSPELRANTLKVSIFRQIKQQNEWRDTDTSKDTVRRLEEQILTKARNLRINATG